LALLGRLLPLLEARASRRPTVLLGAQVGPFRTESGRFLLRRCLRPSDGVVARDAISMSEVHPVVPPAHTLLAADSAFALALERVDIRPVLARRGLDPARPMLALVMSTELRDDESDESHADLLASAARHLLAAGLITQIVIVIQADSDRDAGRRLATLLGLGPDSIVDEDLDPAHLMSLYAVCRIVVSSRLHGVILSLLAGTPAVSAAPEVTFKERAVLDVLGLADLCVPTRDGPGRLSAACARLASDSVTHSRRVDLAVRSAQRTLHTTVPAFLRSALLSHPV
jgi:polysaccharide pyruvyl transferase WcaK-like protein